MPSTTPTETAARTRVGGLMSMTAVKTTIAPAAIEAARRQLVARGTASRTAMTKTR